MERGREGRSWHGSPVPYMPVFFPGTETRLGRLQTDGLSGGYGVASDSDIIRPVLARREQEGGWTWTCDEPRHEVWSGHSDDEVVLELARMRLGSTLIATGEVIDTSGCTAQPNICDVDAVLIALCTSSLPALFSLGFVRKSWRPHECNGLS